MKTIMITCTALLVATAYFDAQVKNAMGGSFFLTSNFSEAANVLKAVQK